MSKEVKIPSIESLALRVNENVRAVHSSQATSSEPSSKHLSDNKAASLEEKVDVQQANNFNGAPWRKAGEHYHPGVTGLHQEILHFYEFISPTAEEHMMRMHVVERIRAIIKCMWPHAEVEPYGSFAVGIYLPTSDIDLTVTGKWADMPLYMLKKALLTARVANDDCIKVLDKASVPIIKLIDRDTNIKVDISFNTRNAVKSARLIQKFQKQFPNLSKLVMVLKQFLLQRNLNEVFTGGISSYSLILMTVSFLQQHPRRDATLPNANLGVLLIEFFQYYGKNFEYSKYAIRVKDSGSLVLKSEIEKSMCDSGYRPSMLCIEDPYDPTNDVGKSSYGVSAARNAFESALSLLNHACGPLSTIYPDASILGTIISVNEHVMKYRQWLKEKFRALRAQSTLLYGCNIFNCSEEISYFDDRCIEALALTGIPNLVVYHPFRNQNFFEQSQADERLDGEKRRGISYRHNRSHNRKLPDDDDDPDGPPADRRTHGQWTSPSHAESAQNASTFFPTRSYRRNFKSQNGYSNQNRRHYNNEPHHWGSTSSKHQSHGPSANPVSDAVQSSKNANHPNGTEAQRPKGPLRKRRNF